MSRALGLAPVLVLLAATVVRPADPILPPLEPPRPDALAPALKQEMARRTALDRIGGPRPPFDLTYLPQPTANVHTLIAVRPDVLFAHPDLAPAAGFLDTVAEKIVVMGGGRAVGPGFAGLDQLLLCGHMTVVPKPDTGDGKTAAFITGATAFAARAARPVDWAAAVRAWFPKGHVSTHRRAEFWVLTLNLGAFLPGLPVEGFEAGFYAAPDGRTVVCDTRANLADLVDRLADGRPVVPPPGWDRVDTAAVALAIDNRNKQWVWHQPRDPGPALPDPGNKLFLAADQFAVGLNVGPVTRFRALAFCRDPFQAKHARQARRDMLARLSDRLAPGENEPASPARVDLAALTDALLKDGTATRTPLGFEYVGEAPGDLIGRVVRMLAAAEASRPRAPVVPVGFSPPQTPPPPPPPPGTPPPVVPDPAEVPRTRSPIPGDQGVPGYLQPATAPLPAPPPLRPGF